LRASPRGGSPCTFASSCPRQPACARCSAASSSRPRRANALTRPARPVRCTTPVGQRALAQAAACVHVQARIRCSRLSPRCWARSQFSRRRRRHLLRRLLPTAPTRWLQQPSTAPPYLNLRRPACNAPSVSR